MRNLLFYTRQYVDFNIYNGSYYDLRQLTIDKVKNQ